MIDCKDVIDKGVHCSTEEQANELLKIANEQGFKWGSGDSLTLFNLWMCNTDNTIYYFYENNTVAFGNVNYCNKQIIKFDELSIKKEKFNKYDIVSYKGHVGLVVGYNSANGVLVLFKKKWNSSLHNGNRYVLTNGFSTIENSLPDKCWFYSERELKLEIPHMAKVKVNNGTSTFTGQYVAVADFDLLIERDDEVFGHNGSEFYTFDGINCSEFTKKECRCTWHRIEDITVIKEGENEMKTKYTAIKKISGQTIINENPCSTEFEKFVKEYGFFNQIEWTKETEDKFEKEDGWISFLVDNNFIEKSSHKIEFNNSKIYCVNFGGDIYKISKFKNNISFSIFLLSGTQKYASVSQEPRSWDNLIYHLTDEVNVKIEVFDSMSQAVEYYNL